MKYILKTSKYALIISSNLHINSVFMSVFALQPTVVEEEEDGVIYTVTVKQHHGGPNSPMVSLM